MKVLGHQRRLDRLPAGSPAVVAEGLLAASDFVVHRLPSDAQSTLP